MDDTASQESTPIKRNFIVNEEELKYQPQDSKGSGKGVLLIIGLLIILSLGGFFLNQRFNLLPGGGGEAQPEVSPTPEPTPSSIPEPALIRSEWSFEVLNGSGITGQAKKVADKIKALGYEVVKTGNADKSNYEDTQILVKKELLGNIDLVIVDLKDVIKIASVAGELTEGTASARIIIGKDSI